MTDEHLACDVTGTGPLLVLVHGTAPPTWGALREELEGSYRVVSYARRSFPPSEGGPATSLRQHADDLDQVIQSHGGPAIIVAWSIGGVIALDLALRNPASIVGLVVIEAPLHIKRHPSVAMVRAVVGAQLRGKRRPEEGARRFLTWALGRRDGSSDIGRLDTTALAEAAPAIVAELALGTGEREITRSALGGLEVPVRWLIGGDGLDVFARAGQRAAAQSSRIALEVVPGAGHPIQLDAPDAVLDAVRRL